MESKLSKPITIGKMKWLLFLLGTLKIPLIGFIKPRLIEVNDQSAKLKIKLRRRSKNHLNSMYFGALAVGADVAAGIHAFYFSKKMGKPVSFAFKSVQADFLKRAESDVVFSSDEGHLVMAAMKLSASSGERVNQPIHVLAKDSSGEIVATFVMEVSVKVK
ncbi:MAG: DUF4442 domain-containing protein [Crocinitomicaceae bacterium]|nr:DUF4442 domain-containing protein [Crocinitomicaceae bacterium]